MPTVLLAASCGRSPCKYTRTEQAEFFAVRGEYTLILPRPTFMQAAFGPDWASQSLFYSSNRGIAEGGAPAILSSRPRSPLAKGYPVLIISGTGWPDLYCGVYSLERKQIVGLRVNLVLNTIVAEAATPSLGTPELRPNGTLVAP